MKEIGIDTSRLVRRIEGILKSLAEARIMSRYRRVFLGKGLEFMDYRVYSEQDDYSRIDWKASMRGNKLLIREYKEERELDVYILLDVGSSMIFGSTDKLKNEHAAEITAAISHLVIKSEDKIGLIMYSDKIKKEILPANTKDQFFIVLRALADPKYYGGKSNLRNVLEHLMRLTKRKSLLIIISDFLNLEKNWEGPLKIANEKFDMMMIVLRDIRDEVLLRNIGKVVISNPYTNKYLIVDPDLISREYEEYNKLKKAQLIHTFKKYGLDYIDMRTDEDFTLLFLKILKRREMKLA